MPYLGFSAGVRGSHDRALREPQAFQTLELILPDDSQRHLQLRHGQGIRLAREGKLCRARISLSLTLRFHCLQGKGLSTCDCAQPISAE
jgi:hypothetical protein